MTRNHIKYALLFSHAFICVVLLAFYHYAWSSFSIPSIVGLTTLTFLACFYRPRWAFWFFVGLLPFEALSLTEDVLPISLRPYQIIGGALFVATMLNIVVRRTTLRMLTPTLLDGFVLLIGLGGVIGAFFAQDSVSSFRLAFILCTFMGMYFLTRIFVTKMTHLRMPVKFLGISAVMVSLYGILQNFTFISRGTTTAVMPGRPNATFSEADWFGMFLVFALAVCTSLVVYYLMRASHKTQRKDWYCIVCLWGVQSLIFAALILSVARSAWVGVLVVAVVTLICLMGIAARRAMGIIVFLFGGSLLMAYCLVALMGLSRFDLSDRAVSTASGLQEITVSCEVSLSCTKEACNVPAIRADVAELEGTGCRFIDLEEIDREKSTGMIVTTTTRPDPNITLRKNIFAQSWQQIKDHPFVGIGWGSIGEILGQDGSGTSLNSSNLFLQVYLGSGLLGFIGVVGIMLILLRRSGEHMRRLGRQISTSREAAVFAYGIFIILGGVAIIVPNLFNAGLLTGFVWVYLGCTQIKISNK